MDFRELQYVLSISREGSISRAAEHLYLSQPSLSMILKSVEEELGLALFERSSTGVTPTPAGEIFLQTAGEILRLYNDMQGKLHAYQPDLHHDIRLGIPPAKSALFLHHIMSAVEQQYPYLSLTVVEKNSKLLEEMLVRSEIDLALISTPMNNAQLPYRAIAKEEVVFAVSRDHPLLRRTHLNPDRSRIWLDPAELADENFIMLQSGGKLRSIFDTVFAGVEAEPHMLYTTGNTEVALEMARQGLGVTMVSSSWVFPGDGLRFISVGEAGTYRDIVVAYRPTMENTPVLEALAGGIQAIIVQKLPLI